MAQTHTIASQSVTPPREAFAEIRQSLPSEVATVSPFVEPVMRLISRFRVTDGSEIDIEVALREALLKAIKHGNREDPYKRVCVTNPLQRGRGSLITVRRGTGL